MERNIGRIMSDSGYPASGSDISEQGIFRNSQRFQNAPQGQQNVGRPPPPATPLRKSSLHKRMETPPPPMPSDLKTAFHRTPTPRRPVPIGLQVKDEQHNGNTSTQSGRPVPSLNLQASPIKSSTNLPPYQAPPKYGMMTPPRSYYRGAGYGHIGASPTLQQTSTPTRPKTPTRNLKIDFDDSVTSLTSATLSEMDQSHSHSMMNTPTPSPKTWAQRSFSADTTPCIEGWDVSMDSTMISPFNNSYANKSIDSHNVAETNGQLPIGFGGWSPRKQVKPPEPPKEHEDERKKAQINAYVAWVNAQLKKRAGTRLIEDLKTDMQDGVALAILVETVAGEPLERITYTPSSNAEKIQNIDSVIQFMTCKRIRMHHTTAKDIVDGNIKSIMRLILALAAHFKPNSVKQSAHSRNTTPSKQEQSVVGLAQSAVASLADARRDAENTLSRPKRPRQLVREERSQRRHGNSTGSDSDQSHRDIRNRHLDGASSCSSPTQSQSPRSSGAGSPNLQRRLEFEGAPVPRSKSSDFRSEQAKSEAHAEELEKKDAAFRALKDEHDTLSDEMQDTKKALLILQDLLLSGQPPDGAESSELSRVVEASNRGDEAIILRAKLQQQEELCKDLREELSRAKNDTLQLQGVKSGLQQRLSEQENSFLVMKAELLRAGFCQQSLENTKADLEQKMTDKDKTVLDLRRELARKDREIDELQTKFQLYQQDKENAARNLRAQITDLHEKLKRVGDTEANLSARVANQDKKMQNLEGKILQTQYDPNNRPSSARSVQSTGSDDFQIVRDTLRNLRGRMQGDETHHATIDSLEKSISSLMERLQVSEASFASRMSETSRRLNYDSTGDVRRSPITALQGFPVQRLESANTQAVTKVLYFTDRTVTPFMCSIPKRLGEICMGDIKNLFGQTGNYRYHFKALDPEFGTVKEEITHDDDIVPGWEGKIVAWIEEDTG